jgi:hypothetical protein
MRCCLAITLAAVFSAGPAAALDLPARKAGLWDITMTFEGRNLAPQTSHHCVDAETDKLMNMMSGSIRQECSKQDLQQVGNTIVIDSVCKFGATTTTSHAVMSGDFNSAYTVKMASTREGGPPLPGVAPGATTNMTIAAKWLGACQADQRPGDIVMATGQKMNIRDIMSQPQAVQPQR